MLRFETRDSIAGAVLDRPEDHFRRTPAGGATHERASASIEG